MSCSSGSGAVHASPSTFYTKQTRKKRGNNAIIMSRQLSLSGVWVRGYQPGGEGVESRVICPYMVIQECGVRGYQPGGAVRCLDWGVLLPPGAPLLSLSLSLSLSSLADSLPLQLSSTSASSHSPGIPLLELVVPHWLPLPSPLQQPLQQRVGWVGWLSEKLRSLDPTDHRFARPFSPSRRVREWNRGLYVHIW